MNFDGFGRADGVSPNRPLQESIGAHSDTGQAVKFKLQQDAGVDVAVRLLT